MKRFLLITLLLSILVDFCAQARKANYPIRKWYFTHGMDGAIFSSATVDNLNPLQNNSNIYNSFRIVPRFTLFFNAGTAFHYNFNRFFGIFSGLDIKNIGFIEQSNGETIKRRTYNLGIPLAIKLGDMRNRRRGYLFLGGGIDMPFNYKEKEYEVQNEKTKYNEWFSKAIPSIMPYYCAGLVNKKGLCLKFQYYPNNYLNPNYVNTKIPLPNNNMDVKIFYISLGYTFSIKNRSGSPEMNETLPSGSVSLL